MREAFHDGALAQDDLRYDRTQLPPGLIRAERILHHGGLAGAVDEPLERDVVLRAKGHALALAMVREDDHVVRPVRGLGRVSDPAESPIDATQDVERVVALDTGMVRHLVVADERGIDDGAAGVGVGDHRLHGDVTQDHDRDGAQQRVAHTTMHARDDVTA